MVARLRRWLPIAATISTILLSLLLPAAIFLTAISFQWLAFLVGVLVAASMALASRASRARWVIARRDAQLRSLRARLAQETAARLRAQELLAASVQAPAQALAPVAAAAADLPPPSAAARDELPQAPRAQAVVAAEAPSPAPQPPDDVAGRIAAALASDHFSLYLREVVRIRPGAGVPEFGEVLMRLDEEDDYHLPPGAFFALAEECGMLPALDAWQVGKLVRWIAAAPSRRLGTWALSLSTEALAQPSFVERVRAELRERRVAARCLCIEVGLDDLRSRADAAPGLRELQKDGCRLALVGFGGGPACVGLVREIQPDYLKIDAGIVVGVARSDRQAARLAALNRVAHASGISTVADCVEDDETLRRLVALGVDFAQGNAISGWMPLPREQARGALDPMPRFAALPEGQVA